MTDGFKVEGGLYQGSALSPFLSAMVMDRLTEQIGHEAPWTMMFAYYTVTSSESLEQVEERPARRRREEECKSVGAKRNTCV